MKRLKALKKYGSPDKKLNRLTVLKLNYGDIPFLRFVVKHYFLIMKTLYNFTTLKQRYTIISLKPCL
jgi:hypothetical protein